MAHRRPWHCYSKWTRRPYQHKRSRNHKREYARGGTQSKIIRYWGGEKEIPWEEWDIVIGMKCNKQVQLSSNALEAIRISVNSSLAKVLGKTGFRFSMRSKPFQKYRENRMLAFAGADRVQSGMRNSFGRDTGVCARVKGGAIICDVGTHLKNLDLVRDRLRIAAMKVPCSCSVVLISYKNVEIMKKAGLPIYNAKKRKDIPIFEFATI